MRSNHVKNCEDYLVIDADMAILPSQLAMLTELDLRPQCNAEIVFNSDDDEDSELVSSSDTESNLSIYYEMLKNNVSKKYPKVITQYKKYSRAEVVPSPTNSLDVFLVHGSFGVEDVENCKTTLNLLSVLEPVCTYLGYGVPNIMFIDLITVHVLKARWFKDCKGDKFWVSPDNTTIPITRAAQKYSDETTQALEAAGFKAMKLVLSKNVHECYKLAGCENAKLPHLATHPCIAWSNPITLRGNIADLQV